MDAESGKTNRAVAREVKYAGEIKQHAARKILKLLLTVRAAETTYAFVLSWRYFRAFRLGLYFQRASTCATARYCATGFGSARARYLWRGMHIYHELRIQWVLWHRWLRMLENHYMYQTPGLKVAVKVRTERAQRFSKLLERRGWRGTRRTTSTNCTRSAPTCAPASTAGPLRLRPGPDRAVRYLLAWRRRLVVLKRSSTCSPWAASGRGCGGGRESTGAQGGSGGGGRGGESSRRRHIGHVPRDGGGRGQPTRKQGVFQGHLHERRRRNGGRRRVGGRHERGAVDGQFRGGGAWRG